MPRIAFKSAVFLVCLSLLVLSTPPAVSADAYVSTVAVPVPVNKTYKEGTSCAGAKSSATVLGRLRNNNLGYLFCDDRTKKFMVAHDLFKIDQKTRKPLVPAAVPTKSTFNYSPFVYINPGKISGSPKTAITAEAQFSNLDKCRLDEADYTGRPHMVTGFPVPAERAVFDDEIIVQVVASDFADVRSAGNPQVDISDATKAVSEFYNRMSGGKTKITWRIPTSYSHLSKDTDSYGLGGFRGNLDGYWQYSKDAVALVDKNTDFTDVEVLAFVVPPTVRDTQVGGFIAEAAEPRSQTVITTGERKIYNLFIQGADQVRDIQNWIHEFGHMLGLTDNGGESGGSKVGFDVMLWYGNPELTIWNRFILGATGPNQLSCINNEQTTVHWIRPVETYGNFTKGVVIPLSKTEAIVVESRRRLGYDALLGKESQGALVYRIDTSKSGNEGSSPIKVIGPKRMTFKPPMQWSVDAPLKLGESVEWAGWTIKVLESGKFGDVISVSKKG